MNGNYLEQRIEPGPDSPSQESFVDEAGRLDGGRNRGVFFSAAGRIFCCLSSLLLLLVWPGSDWIGLLVLSQALFTAAYLLKSTAAGSAAKSSGASGPISLAQGEDHAH